MIATDPRLPQPDNHPSFLSRLLIRLTEVIRSHAFEINKATMTSTSIPTTGDHAQGEFVWNSTPSEAGTAGSKYVTIGWVCVTSGNPGTWKECRCLTGS